MAILWLMINYIILWISCLHRVAGFLFSGELADIRHCSLQYIYKEELLVIFFVIEYYVPHTHSRRGGQYTGPPLLLKGAFRFQAPPHMHRLGFWYAFLVGPQALFLHGVHIKCHTRLLVSGVDFTGDLILFTIIIFCMRYTLKIDSRLRY